MISNVTLSFDLTYTNPVTGALEPRGIVRDLTDYSGLGINLLLTEAKGLGTISFQGDLIVDLNTIGTPMIDLQNWDYVNDGVPTYAFSLPLDLNGNVVNGVYAFQYSLRLSTTLNNISINWPTEITSTTDLGYANFFEAGNQLTMLPSSTNVTVESSSLNLAGNLMSIIVTGLQNDTDIDFSFDATNVQVDSVYTYKGCTKTTADVSFVYDCEYGDSGSWAVTNTTALASNEVVSSLNCTVSYPSWTALTPTFNPQVVLTSLPYPSAPNTETPLATGTYTVSMTESIEQTQTDGLIFIYSTSVIKEFAVSCAGTLCGLVPCIESLRKAHQVDLVRNKVSKYQVYVDNVVLYYMEALNYKACGELDKYQSTIDLIKTQLDSSGCECSCCDDQSYYWVSNNSGVSVIQSLINSFQFRLFNGIPGLTEDTTQGVEIGALWEDYNTGILYRCTDNTEGAAVWVEYYAPGSAPTATDIPADFTGHNYLTANNVQLQLDEVDALAIFDGTNGLTKTGNDVTLGGALLADTTIDANGNTFVISDATNPLTLSVDQPFPAAVGQNLILQTTNTAGSGADGIGSSIEFAAENNAGTVLRTAILRSRWTDATAGDSDFQIGTNEGGLIDIGLTVNPDKSVTLNAYNSTTFEDPAPAYLLGVDASGNVVQTTSSSGPLVYVAKISQGGSFPPTVTEISNTTGETITWTRIGTGGYQCSATGTPFTVGKTIAFISNGFSSSNVPGPFNFTFPSNTHVNLYTFSLGFSGGGPVVPSDDMLIQAMIKIEIYP